MIDRWRMSVPTEGSLSHVGHMGYDPEKGFVSSGVDPSWNIFLTDLESHGIDPQLINQNRTRKRLLQLLLRLQLQHQRLSYAAPAPSNQYRAR